MQTIAAKRVLMVVIAVLSLSLMGGCARIAGVAKDDYRDGKYYPICLVDMDRALI